MEIVPNNLIVDYEGNKVLAFLLKGKREHTFYTACELIAHVLVPGTPKRGYPLIDEQRFSEHC
jgi:hypothetical protein